MKSFLLNLVLASAAAALPQTTSTPPPSFNITEVVAGGTGCPQGSIDVKWTDDAILPICESSTHSFDNTRIPSYFGTTDAYLVLIPPDFGKEFTATVGPKVDVADARKFCQLNLQLEYSAGFSFAVYSAVFAGFANLDGGVTGTVGSRYYFSGDAEQVRPFMSFSCSLFDATPSCTTYGVGFSFHHH